MITSGHVFEGLLGRGEPSSALFENSKNVASSSCRLKPTDTSKIAEQREGFEQRTVGLYNTHSSLCQEVRDLELSILFRDNLFSKLYDGRSEKSDLGTATLQTLSVGKSISRLKKTRTQDILQSQSCASKK